MRAPIAFARRVSGGRLSVECPDCQVRSEVDYAGVRPLPSCGHTVDVRAARGRLRVMKARRWGDCAVCQRPTLPGQKITNPGDGWVHLSCLDRPAGGSRTGLPQGTTERNGTERKDPSHQLREGPQ